MPVEGQRSMAYIVNLERNDQLPATVEQLFQGGGGGVQLGGVPVCPVGHVSGGGGQPA